MQLFKTLLITGIVAAAAVSCASPAFVQQDESVNIENYKTYMWVDTRSNENDSSSRASSYADISVRNEANAMLSRKGWREVSENPDVIIGYDILVERSTDQRNEPVYSQPMTRTYYNRFTRRWSTIYYPSQFLGYDSYQVPVKEGTVTISMMDAKTDKNIWQGWTTVNMNYSRLSDSEVTRSVRNILNKFKPAS